MKKILTVLLMLCSASLFAQTITTASAYFKTISEYYATLKDYEANFEIKMDKKESAGRLSYKSPNLLRLDYTNPDTQVICFNGDTLTVYLPEYTAALQQQASTEGTLTSQGLSLLSRYYTVSYETSQNPEPLESGSEEMVIKFVLGSRNASEAFRYIKLAVNANTKLIRRVEAVTPKGEVFTFDFYDYQLNQGLSEQRFIYDAPASANNFNNFVFAE